MTLADLRNVSIVLLAFEAFVLGLVVGAAVYMSLRGTNWLIRHVRIAGPVVQGRFRIVANASENASQRIAAPFISVSASNAKARRVMSFLVPPFKGREKT
jgi:hypothetical protein